MAEPTEEPRGAASRPGSDAGVETLDHEAGPRGAVHGEPEAGGVGRLLRNARVAWAVAVLALLAAVVFGVQWQSLAAEAEAREEAREAAEIMAAQVTTFEGATIDEFVEQLRGLATGEYAAQVTELFNAEFREALRENEVQSVGEVARSFVQDLDGDEAEVFVLVRQTSLNAALEAPVEDELRMDLTLEREDGRWLIADVAVLGPAPAGVAPAPAPDADDPEGDAE